MRYKTFIITALLLVSARASADWFSLSVDPFTFVRMLLPSTQEVNGEKVESDPRNLWLCFELNFPALGAEMGAGLLARFDHIALRVQYRSYWNNERQSGIFWGLYTVAEWRKLYWFYGDDNALLIGWDYPFITEKDTYDSMGLTAGVNIGFRIRGETFGVSLYGGMGFPLYFMWGTSPPDADSTNFREQNFWIRAMDFGLRLDFSIADAVK
jgi:hypothetical protein